MPKKKKFTVEFYDLREEDYNANQMPHNHSHKASSRKEAIDKTKAYIKKIDKNARIKIVAAYSDR